MNTTIKPSKRRLYIVTTIKLTIGFLLSYYLFSKISEQENILDVFLSADTMYISLAIILMIPNILIQSLKWYTLVKTLIPTLSFWDAIASTLGGMSLGALTPGRVGELGKGLFLDNVDKLQITGLALLDRMVNMLAILLTGLTSLIIIIRTKYQLPEMIYLPLAAFVFLSLVIGIYLMINPKLLRFIFQRFERFNSIKEYAKQFFSAIQYVKIKPLALTFLYGILFQFVIATQFFLIVYGYDSSLLFLDGLMSSFCTTLTQAFLPISIADIGIRETAADYYFGQFISNRAAIFNGALTLFFINVLFPSLCGLFMIPKLNFQRDL